MLPFIDLFKAPARLCPDLFSAAFITNIDESSFRHTQVVVPPVSRLRVPADEHFRTMQTLYVGDRSRLDRVHVAPIDRDLDRVVGYALKGLRRRRFSMDDVLVLPRAMSEVRSPS